MMLNFLYPSIVCIIMGTLFKEGFTRLRFAAIGVSVLGMVFLTNQYIYHTAGSAGMGDADRRVRLVFSRRVLPDAVWSQPARRIYSFLCINA